MRIARFWSEVCTTSGSRPAVLEQLTAADRLLLALVREVYVHPSGEQVLRVPFALAVAEEDQLVRCVGHGSERNRTRVATARPAKGRTGTGPESGRGPTIDGRRQLSGGRGIPLRNVRTAAGPLTQGRPAAHSVHARRPGGTHVRRRSEKGGTRDGRRSPQGVLVAVDQHAGQPPRCVRRHLHGALSDPGPGLLGLVRRSRRVPTRARRGRVLAGSPA